MLTSLPIPITRDLVLLGGGHAHALVLLKWAANPLPGVQVTLINPSIKAPYTGMLPGLIAGHYRRSDLDIDLVRLARKAGARLIVDHAVDIDTIRKRVHLSNRADIAYDSLSVDIGITTELAKIPGAKTLAVSAKPLGAFSTQWEDFLERAQASNLNPKIVIIGGGVAGVELALAMAHRVNEEGFTHINIRLIETNSKILRETGDFTRRRLLRELKRYDVEVILNADVKEITEDTIHFSSDLPSIAANFVITAAGAKPHEWLGETNLALHKGYIEVDNKLRSLNTPHVFASGDCAHLTFSPRPKAGVFAVREAPILFENLRADLSGQKMRRYRPQRSYLKLISMGRKSATADKWMLAPQGKWVWNIKDKIDQAFMDKFRQTPTIAPIEIPQDAAIGVKDMMQRDSPQCGGCGSKVAQDSLIDGLAGLPKTGAPFDDAAIINTDEGFKVLSTDHLRAFTSDAYILAKVAAIHAMGDIWAMGAQPETVLSHIVLPHMAVRQQSNMIREIITSANAVFEKCGAKIVGGHTSSGAELTIGFTVMGAGQKTPIRVSGASEGDSLVLTKPIGVGILLAAEMRQLADGDDYQNALDSMCQVQTRAASLLGPVASAMTDVTGFGLAGHLMNMLKASDVSARITLDNIPVLRGAKELSECGIRSSLWSSNAALKSQMSMQAPAQSDLLFDPQTCGGLLATIPSTKITQLLEAFEAAGEPIWKIGEIKTGAPHITVL